jgi:twitching motility protein PilT
MARIDSLLAIVASMNANELQMGTDREPRMLADGAARRLAIPLTPEDTLRELLGEILTPEREAAMRTNKRVEVPYESPHGPFVVTLLARENGFDARFLRRGSKAPRPSSGNVATLPIATAPLSAAADPVEPQTSPATHPPVPPPMPPSSSSTLAALVARAAAMRASDLHLADGDSPRIRVDGRIGLLDSDEPTDVSAVLALDTQEQQDLASSRSIDLARDIPDVGRVRVHAYRTADGLAAAVRLLPRAAPTLSSLRLPAPIDDLAFLPNGLVIVCGASGSGKSTTLAALAQEALRRRSIVLTTLEDPIEYALEAPPGAIIRRRQIGRDAHDFARALRDALRAYPDVILVGEMRDPETIGLALTAAETGHLVLASMHSRSAAGAVERIVDSYPPERGARIHAQLAECLRAIVAQRLLPRARGSGRVVAIEVLRASHAVSALIREGKTAQIATALQSGKKEGMLTLERSLADRVSAGEVKLEDAQAAANDADTLASYLGK